MYLRAFKRKFAGICGERIFERGRRTGRFNAHAVVDRKVTQAEMEQLRDGLKHTTVGWVYAEPVRDDGLGAYMWKELTKEVGRGDRGRERQMAAFGKYRKSKETDFDLKSNFAYCMSLAYDVREPGQSADEIRAFAMWLETQFLLGKFALGGPGGDEACRVYEEEPMVPARWLPTRAMRGSQGAEEWILTHRSWRHESSGGAARRGALAPPGASAR